VAHLVWDWNGTLLDDLVVAVAATNTALASVGGPVVTAEDHKREFCRPVSAYYELVLARKIPADEFAVMDKLFHDAYGQLLADCKLALDALDAMAAWTGTQSLVSMFGHEELVTTVTRYGLYDRFTRVDGRRSVVGGGPKEPHLREHLTALGLAGADCVLIGDSLDDAEAATAVGARVVLYGGGFTDSDRLQATGFPVAATLLDAVMHAQAA
jgi:phosphoglycolate phosphatase-like HAD superfamily hydrolase